MSTCSVPNVLDALCDNLAARADLATVNVWSAAMGEYRGENIVLGHKPIVVTEESLGLGEDDRLETYSIPCLLWVAAAGGEEINIRAARDRAYELKGYVETYLNLSAPQTLSSTCMDAEMEGHTFTQGVYAGSDFNGRWAQIEFTVNVEATKAP